MVLLIPVVVFVAFLIICTLMTVGEPLNPTRPLVSYEQAREYAHRLQRLIACETVSRKEEQDDLPFEQMRSEMQELFPQVHRLAQQQIFGEDCWAYLLPGKNAENNILLLAHHDVAPADGNWKHPPFSGTISDGKIWGRGTVDNKTNLFAIFSALEEMYSEGIAPQSNVWIVSSHNEMTEGNGARLAANYFRQQGITFDLILGQGGAVMDAPVGNMTTSKCAMVAFQEKGIYKLALTAEAGVGQGSVVRATPTERMADFISEFRREGMFIRRMTPELETMLKAAAPYMPFGLKMACANLWLFKPMLVKRLPNISREAAELLGTTCSFNDLVTEADGRRCIARIALRCMDADDLKTDLTRLRTLATKYGIRVESVGESGFQRPSNPKSPALAKVTQCIHDVFPDVPVIPYVLSDTTEARFFADRSDCVLRFSPLRLTSLQLASTRGDDENVEIAAIGTAVVFYRRILESDASTLTYGGMEEDPEEEWEELQEEPKVDTGEIPEQMLSEFLPEEESYDISDAWLNEPLLEELQDYDTAEFTEESTKSMPALVIEDIDEDFLEDLDMDPLEDISDFELNTLNDWEELI